MKAKDMVELNNKKRDLLTDKNEAAYGDMLVYLRLADVPERQVEELLLEILDHLLEAQEDGKNAYDVFGNDLQSYCDELVSVLPSQTMLEKFSFYGFMISLLLAIQFGIDTVAALGFSFSKKENHISSVPFSIPGTLLSIIMITGGIFVILYLLKRDSFNQAMNLKQRITFGLAFSIPFCSSVFFNIHFKKQSYLSYNLPIWQGALLALFFYISYKFLYKTSRF
ncbi:hypothetical protein [Bacillus sp. 123MFChir2]|uniref:hypothetical protein n=1 Tax=Bacillus sp. 123MFChir2 TaxID=1169144 RepID=UPI00035C806A|nr:hypothetical protein [Bacillus sp. 123MFChir2]